LAPHASLSGPRFPFDRRGRKRDPAVARLAKLQRTIQERPDGPLAARSLKLRSHSMSLHRIGKLALLGLVLAPLVNVAQAQQPTAEQPTARQPAAKQTPAKQPTTAPATASQNSASLERAQKEKILASEAWQQAMFKLDEWFSVQPFYDKAQVQQIK